MTNPDMGSMADHYPQRGNQIEAWIKDRRDAIKEATPLGEHMYGWQTLNKLLDEYRAAADNMLSLDEVVNGSAQPPPLTPKRKKKPAKEN